MATNIRRTSNPLAGINHVDLAQLEKSVEKDAIKPRVYFKRWFILLMFIFLSASNGAQWIEYSIIVTIVSEFYDVSATLIDWTSMIYMLTYIFFFIPAAWLLDKYGLRVSVLLGALGNAIGAWVKIMSTNPDGFWITFIGQTIVGTSQIFTLGIPPRLAAVWFGPDEVSTACAAGVFGNQLGIAVGFVTPPLLVHNGTKEDVARDLNVLFLASAVLNTVVLTFILCFFSSKPKVPPSLAQLTQQQEAAFDSNFWGTLKKLMTSKDFLLLFITYGINTGVFYAVSTLLAQIVLEFYPNEGETVGQIGLVIVVAGMAGSVVGGYCLDRFKKFKLITLIVYLCSFLAMLAFTLTLDLGSIAIVFANSLLLGFFMTGFLPIGFEFAAEITYPAAEGTMSGLLNASAQIFGIGLTMFMGWIIRSVGTFWANMIMSGFLVLGTIVTAMITEELRRQKAHEIQAHMPTSNTQLTTAD
ncbi:hypothetical protein WR25_04230 [Diploscapter pachys]|uniref:Choline/ethanolamine transporter FLVCR1 n=1 Tax=Diploscapter pachys TaxID=2018661 RepID=A0A2A2K1C3_9BILA|nr:hypothetical protein WR25_04230 [Diploscapter pachys]